MARIVNLPVGIRNGKGVGGARVVGWLPVVRPTNIKYIWIISNLTEFHRLTTPQSTRTNLTGLTSNGLFGTSPFTSYLKRSKGSQKPGAG